MFSSLLAAFYETARQGGVTAAAKQLSVSQPTITARIQQLEARYGVTLFHRRGSRLELTPAGAGLVPLVRQMLQIQGDIDFKLRNAHELQSGSLRIGATGPHYIVSTIAAFRRQYPNAHIGIEMGNSQTVLEALFEQRVDIAVSSRPLADPRILQYLIASDAMVLVAHPDHPLARRPAVILQDLACHTLLMREQGSSTRQAIEISLDAQGVRPQATLEIGSREMICRAVRYNLGCTLMPVGDVPQDNDLRRVPILPEAPVLDVFLYCLRDRAEMTLTEAFIANLPGHRAPDLSKNLMPL